MREDEGPGPHRVEGGLDDVEVDRLAPAAGAVGVQVEKIDRAVETTQPLDTLGRDDLGPAFGVQLRDVPARAVGLLGFDLDADETPGIVRGARTDGGARVRDEGVPAEYPDADHRRGPRYRVYRVEQPLHARGDAGPGDLEVLPHRRAVCEELRAIVAAVREDARLDERGERGVHDGDFPVERLELAMGLVEHHRVFGPAVGLERPCHSCPRQ